MYVEIQILYGNGDEYRSTACKLFSEDIAREWSVKKNKQQQQQ